MSYIITYGTEREGFETINADTETEAFIVCKELFEDGYNELKLEKNNETY